MSSCARISSSSVMALASGSLVWMSMSAAYGEGGDGALKPWIVPPRAAQKKNPVAADEKALGLGQQLYVRECRSCHGATGRGDGKAPERQRIGVQPQLAKAPEKPLHWKRASMREELHETILLLEVLRSQEHAFRPDDPAVPSHPPAPRSWQRRGRPVIFDRRSRCRRAPSTRISDGGRACPMTVCQGHVQVGIYLSPAN